MRTDFDVQLFTLSHSVSEAANAGRYTDEQLRQLWQQKEEVRKSIQRIRPMTAGSDTTGSSSSYSLPASATTSTLRSSTCHSEPEFCSELSARHPLHAIQESYDDMAKIVDSRPMSIVQLPLTPPCDFKVCQSCRPVYRDRAWISLDAAVDGALGIPPTHEFKNRRIADVDVVRSIGISRLTQRPSTRTRRDTLRKNCKRRSQTEFSNTIRRMLRQSQQFSDDEEHTDQEQGEIPPRRIDEETESLAEQVCQHADLLAMSEVHLVSSARRHGVPGKDSGLPHTGEDSQLFMHIQQPARSANSDPVGSTKSQGYGGRAIFSSAMLEQDVDGDHQDNHSKESSGSTASTRGGLYSLRRTRSTPFEEFPLF